MRDLRWLCLTCSNRVLVAASLRTASGSWMHFRELSLRPIRLIGCQGSMADEQERLASRSSALRMAVQSVLRSSSGSMPKQVHIRDCNSDSHCEDPP